MSIAQDPHFDKFTRQDNKFVAKSKENKQKAKAAGKYVAHSLKEESKRQPYMKEIDMSKYEVPPMQEGKEVEEVKKPINDLSEITDLMSADDPDNAKQKAFFLSIKADVEKKVGKTFTTFEPVLFRQKIENGT